MGNLIWHEYARFVSVTAAVYAVWSSFWAVLYRKFFWDFVGGTVRDPGGVQASPGAAVFITLIVKNPVIQIFAFLLGLFIIAVEFPAPFVRPLAIHRSLVFKLVLVLFQTFFTCLYYQGTNAAIYSFIAATCYTRAVLNGEVMEEAKENRGKGGSSA
jgi:hypothetical protein